MTSVVILLVVSVVMFISQNQHDVLTKMDIFLEVDFTTSIDASKFKLTISMYIKILRLNFRNRKLQNLK